MNRVLLVEDAADCQLIVSRCLQDSAHLAIASSLGMARRLMEADHYELILLDVGLPDGDGYGFCSSVLAEMGLHRPRIVFLTSRGELSQKLTGFSVGADDYLVKPIDPLELKARVEAQLRQRREALQAAQNVRIGNLELDLGTHIAEIHADSGTVSLDLTPTEFKLLHRLSRHEGRIQTREQLLAALFDGRVHVLDRTIDAHLSRIRKKLAGCTHTIEAVYGVGYRLLKVKP